MAAELPGIARAVELVHPDELVPYERNAKTHPAEQVAELAAGIKRFGFTSPILVAGENGILAGHGRLLAARLLGLSEVPIIRLDHLDEQQRRAYVLADNRVGELGGWDQALLAGELAALDDLEGVGFTAGELEAMVDALDELETGTAEPTAAAQAEPPAASSPSAYGAATAMARASAPWRLWEERGDLEGRRVLDFGCGKEVRPGVAGFDAFHRPDPAPLLESWDVVACNYVLNVQPSEHLVTLIAALIRRLLEVDGCALFAIRNDLELGVTSSPRGVQVGRRPEEWAALLEPLFVTEQLEAKGFLAFRGRAREGPA